MSREEIRDHIKYSCITSIQFNSILTSHETNFELRRKKNSVTRDGMFPLQLSLTPILGERLV